MRKKDFEKYRKIIIRKAHTHFVSFRFLYTERTMKNFEVLKRTSLDDSYGQSFSDGTSIVNLLIPQTRDEIIATMVHELAHQIVKPDDAHDITWYRTLQNLFRVLGIPRTAIDSEKSWIKMNYPKLLKKGD